jgi:Niemann-Pick C1 protein
VRERSSAPTARMILRMKSRVEPQMLLLLLLGLAASRVVEAAEEGHCVWYGECYRDMFTHAKNCPYEGEPKELDMIGQKIFAKHCPHMMPANGGIPKTCCDTQQLKTLDSSVSMASNILQRCPSCLSNFEKQICEFTCSPHQSTFVNVTQIATTDNVTYIDGIAVYFTPQYLNGTYKSCSRVSMPSSGQLALDLMCGEYGAARCSPEKWFHSMGDINNPFVPFQIDYIASDKPVGKYIPMDPEVTPCNKALNVSLSDQIKLRRLFEID